MKAMGRYDENVDYKEKYETLVKSIMNLASDLIEQPESDPVDVLVQISGLIDDILDESVGLSKEITRLQNELEEVKA